MLSNKNIYNVVKMFLAVLLSSEMLSTVNQNTAVTNSAQFFGTKIKNVTVSSFSAVQHHASIRLKYFSESHMCSGVVIGSSVVLTTAQCVYNYNKNKPYHPSELIVVLGSITNHEQPVRATVYSVTHSFQPERFNALNLNDNVAILMLDRDIFEVNEYVKPLVLAHREIFNPNGRNNKQQSRKFEVSTWLKTNEKASNFYQSMLLNASIVNDESCLRYYGKSLFASGMLCVNDELMNKDWGSPLFSDNVLWGLRSFSSGRFSATIYTDISHHTAWISSLIGDGSHQNSSLWGTLGFLLFTFMVINRTRISNLQ